MSKTVITQRTRPACSPRITTSCRMGLWNADRAGMMALLSPAPPTRWLE